MSSKMPGGGMARTVRGDILATELGKVDAHDHLMITGGPATVGLPDLLLDDENDALAEARAFRAAGGGTVVDMMPPGAGRDVLALERISRQSGVHVIAVSGFHLPHYYDRLHFVNRATDDELLEILNEDIVGADATDYWFPQRHRSAVRPGALKAATGYNQITERQRRILGVVAEAARCSGLPVITHTSHGTMALEQVRVLTEAGIPTGQIALSHMDRNPDFGLHRELLEAGVYLVYDGAGREKYHPVSSIAELFNALAEAGLAGRILFGGDNATGSTRRSKGGTGIAGVLSAFVAGLVRNGSPVDALNQSLGIAAQTFFSLRKTAHAAEAVKRSVTPITKQHEQGGTSCTPPEPPLSDY